MSRRPACQVVAGSLGKHSPSRQNLPGIQSSGWGLSVLSSITQASIH